MSRESIRLADTEQRAASFVFTVLDASENTYAIQCADRAVGSGGAAGGKVVGNYLCWDTNRFEFRDAIGPWEKFTIMPMSEHGHEYFVLKCHMGFLDADGKDNFKARPSGVRCYIVAQ